MKNGSDLGPRGDRPVAAGTQSWRRGEEGAAASPGGTLSADRVKRGDQQGGLGGTTERTLTGGWGGREDAETGRAAGRGAPECTEAAHGPGGARLRRRPRDTHQTRWGGRRGAGGDGADATCGQPKSDRDAPGTPRERGTRAATGENNRKNPNCRKRRQREGAKAPRYPSDCGEGPPRPRLRMRHPPAALARQQNCACAETPNPLLHPSPGFAQSKRLREAKGEQCGAGSEVLGLGRVSSPLFCYFFF